MFAGLRPGCRSVPGLLRHRHPRVRAAHRVRAGAHLAIAPAGGRAPRQRTGRGRLRSGRDRGAGLGDRPFLRGRQCPLPRRAAAGRAGRSRDSDRRGQPRPGERLLSWAPLRWIGVRSYAIYLWHWPVIVVYGRSPATSQPSAREPLETAVAIALAAASWRWIEEPILRNGLRATLRSCYRVVAGLPAAARCSPWPAASDSAARGGDRHLHRRVRDAAPAWSIRAGPADQPAARSARPARRSRLYHPRPRPAGAGYPAPYPGAPCRGAPARQRPASAGPADRRTAARVPAHTVAPGAGPPAAPSAIAAHGSEVTAIGDSVMLAAPAN